VRRSAPRSRRFRLAPSAREHLAEVTASLERLDRDAARVDDWGARLARATRAGARVLTLGAGRSAAVADELAGELLGGPVSALCLNADAIALGSLTADHGIEQALARELGAHGRAGDVLIAYVADGRSQTLIAALRTARQLGLTTFALTGEDPGEVADLADDLIALPAPSRRVLQELQLVTVHLLSAAVERELALSGAPSRSGALVRA
jgi:phosphoheptose isomerase